MISVSVNMMIPLKYLKLHKLRFPATTERDLFQHFLQMFSHYRSYLTLVGLASLLLLILFRNFKLKNKWTISNIFSKCLFQYVDSLYFVRVKKYFNDWQSVYFVYKTEIWKENLTRLILKLNLYFENLMWPLQYKHKYNIMTLFVAVRMSCRVRFWTNL